ncbi:hypothetical protein [Bilophila sp.]
MPTFCPSEKRQPKQIHDRRGNLDPDRESGPVATRFMGGMAAGD